MKPPRRRPPRYEVRAIPNSTDVTGETLFAVSGPGVHDFAMMDAIAELLEQTLNAAAAFKAT